MLRLMRRAMVGALAALLLAAPAGAAAQGPPSGYDGRNPFKCTLQQLGTGTKFPQPGADPFCVEYDKTHQNVTELGVVQFLSQEPARVAAASPKCFYFQHDHWTGSIVEGQPPETYHWDGSYFFNKATGSGGAYVENFRIGGQTGDPTTLPGFPEEWKPYFSAGRGGVQASGDVQADPSCATKPNPSGPGGSPPPSGGPSPAPALPCRVPGGRVGRGIGGLDLGMRRARARKDLGLPMTESKRWMTWCFDGGGRLYGAFAGHGADLVLTDSAPFDTHGIRRGTKRKTALRRLHGERRLGRVHGAAVYAKRERHRRLLVGLRRGRVAYLAVTKRKLSAKRALRLLRTLP